MTFRLGQSGRPQHPGKNWVGGGRAKGRSSWLAARNGLAAAEQRLRDVKEASGDEEALSARSMKWLTYAVSMQFVIF